VELSREFRKNAAECLKLSQEADSLESQGYWIAMAQLWFELAVHAEDREAIEGLDPVAAAARPNDSNSKSN
jgi:hypothetical protein